jgi:hypothetical protein
MQIRLDNDENFVHRNYTLRQVIDFLLFCKKRFKMKCKRKNNGSRIINGEGLDIPHIYSILMCNIIDSILTCISLMMFVFKLTEIAEFIKWKN